MLRWIVWRDLMLAWRRRSDMLSTVFFFVMVVSLFPLGIGPEMQLLRSIAPGVVWVAALLASMLSLGRVFANDYQDGTLEQLLLTPQPLYLVVIGKVIAHWLVAEIPLVVIAPLVGVQFDLRHVVDSVCEPAGRHADFEFDWVSGSGAYFRTARRRSADFDSDSAALHSGIDLWRWRS